MRYHFRDRELAMSETFKDFRWFNLPSSKTLKLAAICAAAFCVAAAITFVALHHSPAPAKAAPAPWNSAAIRSTFAGIQVRQVDATTAAVVFFYDIENTTDFDYRIDNVPGMFFLSRLKSDGSLSSENQPHLDHPAFVPARNRTRIGLQLVHPFQWPAQSGAASDDKFRQFVKRATDNLEGFVLFDQSTRYEVELRGAWPQLEQASSESSPN
jgi:hypothetical protein